MKKIKVIKIKGFMGYEELELDMNGKRVIAKGRNGKGKTSLINAIKAGVTPGYPVELIKDGAEEGEIGIVFDDMSIIQKLISRQKKSAGAFGKFQYVDSNGNLLSKSTDYFKNLGAHLAFDPGAIVDATGKELQDIIMKALPLEANADDFKEIFKGISINEFKDIFRGESDPRKFVENSLEKHPLEAISLFYDGIYSYRRNINTKESQATKTAKQLEPTIPANENFQEKIIEIKSLKEQAERSRREALNNINTTLNDLLQNVNDKYEMEASDIKEKYDSIRDKEADRFAEDIHTNTKSYERDIERISQQIRELEKVLIETKMAKENAISKLTAEKQSVLDKVNTNELEAKNQLRERVNQSKEKAKTNALDAGKKVNNDTDVQLAELDGDLKVLEEKQFFVEQANIQREIVAKMKAEALELKLQSEKYTSLLHKLEKVKERYLQDIPIKSLDFNNGEFYYMDKRAATCSTGEKMLLASEISVLFAEKTGMAFVLWDNLDHLDDENLKKAYQIFEEKNIQLIGALVSSNAELQFAMD